MADSLAAAEWYMNKAGSHDNGGGIHAYLEGGANHRDLKITWLNKNGADQTKPTDNNNYANNTQNTSKHESNTRIT